MLNLFPADLLPGMTGRVFITGGTGSLGTAILARAAKENWPCTFTVMARNEAKINQTRARFPDVTCRVGDVQDLSLLETLFVGHDAVIHAAAAKVVPLAEANVRGAILTNVIGTMNVAHAAVAAGVRRVIPILTDKLVKATTVYGATKFLAGAICREAAAWSKTEFCAVRYGNVLGSSNSLVPLLYQQLEQGKPFTLTDTRCTRFWLTMDQAIDLILMAYHNGVNGTVIVPKAPASFVGNIALAIAPTHPVHHIGIRPGEKIDEQLLDEVESRTTEDHGDWFVVYPPESKGNFTLPPDYGYYSSDPAHWLTVDELKEMIASA